VDVEREAGSVVESLGFSPDARVLIVNCDDFGMSLSINAGVVRAIDGGIASSCSLMVPCDAAADAMQILHERPDIPFGVHLTWGEPAREELRRRGLAAVDHDVLDSFSLELDGKFDRYQQLLRAVPVGLTEWAAHPAACEAGAGVRSSDLEFLVSPQAADTIRSAQIHVISCQRLRESWRQRASSVRLGRPGV
jgi:hypothetical protein